MDHDDIRLVERVLASLEAKTMKEDEVGQRLIRKYKRLLKEARREVAFNDTGIA